MPFILTGSSMLQCTFGAAPCALEVLPLPGKPQVEGQTAAAITDITPVNIPGFGMCSSMANPAVASATAAAQGVLTPMPCTPVVVAPWAPPSPNLTVAGLPAALATSRCACAFGGMISAALDPNFIAEA